ncbi:MAG: helix-turn-helix domain-containing protein [Caldilineaceae bacterium]|nr:helix-turn-helix domain-containing protein [Caldilineaceae bacterium]
MDSAQTDNVDSLSPLSGDKSTLLQFIENMGLHFEEYGVPRIGGRILGLLLASSRPISPEEMAELLQVSRSSVSTNLRTLVMTGLADRVSLPGERSDFYTFADDAWEKSLEMRLDGIHSLREMAEDGLVGMDAQHPARARLEEILAWTAMVQGAFDTMLQQWQSHKENPR